MTRSVSKALIERAMAACNDSGYPVHGLRLCANGDVLVLTDPPEGGLPTGDDLTDELNDWSRRHGYG